MSLVNIGIVISLILYVIKEMLAGKIEIPNNGRKGLYVYDAVFTYSIILLVVIGEVELIVINWWLIIILALPSFYFQILEFRDSLGSKSNKWLKFLLKTIVFFAIMYLVYGSTH